MLGVRREGVTEAAGRLQQAGVISYRRGHITVVDRSGLEAQVCECYQVVKGEFARLLPDLLQRQDPASAPPTTLREVAARGAEPAKGRK
jgi:hypothetical protein